MLISRAPISENCKVRGIGVADIVSVSTFVLSLRSFSFVETPNFCSSSMISSPKSCHFTNSEKVHENMAYYCKFLTTEARKRGFSTFVWDNSHFGNGSEKYGIFDRFKSMKVNAPWVLEGIFGK